MKAASHSPSAVLISTSRSTVSGGVPAVERLAATQPAAADSATKARRVRSSGGPEGRSRSLSCVLMAWLLLPPRPGRTLIQYTRTGWGSATAGEQHDRLRDTGYQ